MNVMLRIVVSSLVLLAGACASTTPTSSQARAAAAQPAWRDANEVVGGTGLFVVRYRTAPLTIPMNAEFAIRAWVFAANDREHPLDDVELAVDAAMPEHKHGMARTPRVERRSDGSFGISGMLFHMPGRWELYFDVTREALTERAQTRVELE
ncbi:MAG: hypothetical protein K8S98_08385 [Planctomycetes bacterium]|nr:hypothetical protein [Planctomycetota bacterium]